MHVVGRSPRICGARELWWRRISPSSIRPCHPLGVSSFSTSSLPLGAGDASDENYSQELDEFLGSLSSTTRNVRQINLDTTVGEGQDDDVEFGDAELGVVGSSGAFGELDADYVNAVKGLGNTVTRKQNVLHPNAPHGAAQAQSQQATSPLQASDRLSSLGRLSKQKWVELFRNQILLRIHGLEDDVSIIAQHYKVDESHLRDVMKYCVIPTFSSDLEEKKEEQTIGGVPINPDSPEAQLKKSDLAYWISPMECSPPSKDPNQVDRAEDEH